MSIAPYQHYKDSGVKWLGRVPISWEVRRIRHLFEIRKRICGAEGHGVLSITQQGIKAKDIESGDGQLSADYSKYQFVEVGDFAMNHMDLLTGYVDISSMFGVTSPDYRVFAVRDRAVCFDKYYLYLFQTGYRNRIFYAFGQGSSQLGRWRFPTDEFNSFEFPLPPIEEQKNIATFLDHETVKIDALIAEQEQLIALLKEKHQGVISHAVTKGLDRSAPTKNSGTVWIGDVPKHWDITTFRRVARIEEGQVSPTDKKYSNSILIAPNHIESGTGRLLSLETAAEQAAISGKYRVRAGEVIYSKIRPALNKACISDIDCLCSADMYPIRALNGLLAPFLLYLMLSQSFVKLMVDESMRVAMPKINRDTLNACRVAIPPVQEQEAIVRHISIATKKYDSLTAEANLAIELLQERRAALVSAAVTGKIDVRGFVGVQPQEVAAE
jgi:type I restriction enzyme S subunit